MVGFYGSGSLREVLEKAREYERLYMQRYPLMGLTLRLLSFSPVPASTDPDALVALGATNLDRDIERLRAECHGRG